MERFSRARIVTWTLTVAVWSVAGFGYILPWGQLSYWAATVIANVLGAIPVVGDQAVQWVWSGSTAGAASVGPLAWFVAAPTAVVWLDVFTGLRDRLPGRPRSGMLLLAGIALSALLGAALLLLNGTLAPSPPADPLGPLSPLSITPPLSFLPQYALLRSMPNKLLGVAIAVAAVLALATWPIARADRVRQGPYARVFFAACAMALLNWAALGAVGSMRPDRVAPGLPLALAGIHFALFIGGPPLWRVVGARRTRLPNESVFD